MLTQQPLSFSLSRQRMQLALLFELPAQLNQGLCELQCHLRVEGTRCPPYGSGVFVLALQWNADGQKLEGFPRKPWLSTKLYPRFAPSIVNSCGI